VHREAAVAPGEHAGRLALAENGLRHQQLEHLGTKTLFEQLHRNRRQHDKRAVGAKDAVGSLERRQMAPEQKLASVEKLT